MFLPTHADLFEWREQPIPVDPWEPAALTKEQWPPDYKGVYAWRLQQLELLKDPVFLASAKAYYADKPGFFIMDWMDTYNPRKKTDKWMPFVFFWRQQEFITFLHELRTDGESGLVEKCRDAGATWLACGYTIWSWLFIDNDAIGWGSRKQDLVHKLGDPDSIFEKMFAILRRLPECFLPSGFSFDKHATFMRLINPENGSIVSGEAGDKIGRGGRKSMYFKDESAHYPRAEIIEGALGDNTNVQVDISSVNGLGNVFHRRRESGVDWTPGCKIPPGFVRVFVIDWADHPEKTPEWYAERKAKAEREGLMHLFAQEVDRNYAAAVANTIIAGEWIKAAFDAHLKISYLSEKDFTGGWSAALDVADDGLDRNALVKLQGLILRHANEWGERDPGVATRNVIGDCQQHKGIKIQYDSIGLGVAVKSEFNRLVDAEIIKPTDIEMVPWNAGAAVVDPEFNLIHGDRQTPLNEDYFQNMKAQAWWSLRSRFYKTWRAVTQGIIYPVDELISIDSTIPLIRQIEKELAQPTIGKSPKTLKMIVNKKPDGTRSPNIADAIVMAYFPVREDYAVAAQGVYGNV